MADPESPAARPLPHAHPASHLASRAVSAPARALRALRDQLGWTAVALGAGLCFLGWYGVSGQRYTAQQVPYLASATAPGAALLLGGFVLIAARQRSGSDDRTPEQERILRQLELLYGLLTQEAAAAATADQAPAAAPPTPPTPGTHLLAVPGGQTYHRPDCLLLQGRADAEPTSTAQAGLRPCPLCDPPAPLGS